MKSRFWETPDGSAFHPHTSHSPEGGATQRALSADGVSTESNIPEIDALRKGLPPFFWRGLRATHQGGRNVYGRANETCAESVGTWGSISGDWGFPSEEITCLHQVHPVNNKRLLKMKSRFWETPDGSAFHPHTSHSPEGGATQQALSADGVSIESNIPEIDALRKGLPPFFFAGPAGGTKRREERAGRRCVESGRRTWFPRPFFLRRAFKNMSRVPRGRALLRFGKKEVFMLELSQGVRGVRFAYADGVSDFVTEEGIISRAQDVTEIIRQNRAEQNIQRCGFQKAPTFRKVASIPVTVVDIAAAQGLDILNDPEAMRKFLNDPDNRAFRTTLERV